jgi:formylglycine-generating enzyme required for sulfatase activity
MYTQFLKKLEGAEIEMDLRDLADALWLAQFDTREASTAAAARRGTRPPSRLAGEKEQPSIVEPPEPTPEQMPPEQPQGQKLYAKTGQESSRATDRAFEVLIPGASPVPNALEIGRALRPLARRRRSSRDTMLDEEATAQASAECGFTLPVFSPAPERWFSVALVVEETAAMAVWQETADELARLMAQHGGFNEVTQWRLRFEGDDAHLVSPAKSKQPLSRLSLLAERQLILLLTDGASSRWRDGKMSDALERWGERSPVVIVQVLGERMWPHTPLGAPPLLVKSQSPGSPNRDLACRPRWQTILESPPAAAMPFPVIALDHELIAEWARMLMQPGALYTAVAPPRPLKDEKPEPAPRPPGLWRWILDRLKPKDVKRETPPPVEPTPAERISNFRNLVSKDAYELAIYLSWMPLSLPVMRLVQAKMLPHPRPEQLSEVLLGGLIKRLNRNTVINDPDDLRFDFYDPEVRRLLQNRIRRDEIPPLLRSIADYFSRLAGQRYSFTALIPHLKGDKRLPVETDLPFAEILLPALERLGLKHLFVPGDGDGGPGRPPIESFSFVTVRLDERGKEIERRTLSARHCVEDLGEGVTLEMVEIPGGKFMMGTAEAEVEKVRKEYKRLGYGESWVDAERPQHEIRVPPFFIGKHAVTQTQWRAVAQLPKVKIDLKPDPSHFKGDKLPVESVSWDEAKEFVARLNAKLGLGEENGYRLPSEAEWEYAARAGSQTAFAFGETINPEIVNYNGDYPYGQALKGKNRGKTIAVGSLGVANAWGLFDMHGNVWEWCEDNWHGNYDGAPTDGSAWVDISRRASYRVLRGGGWVYDAAFCRSAFRYYYSPGYRYRSLGFRLSRTYR